jgi:hypothetical protein
VGLFQGESWSFSDPRLVDLGESEDLGEELGEGVCGKTLALKVKAEGVADFYFVIMKRHHSDVERGPNSITKTERHRLMLAPV